MITLIITLAVIGFIVWALITYIPMPPLFKNAIIVISLIMILLYLLRVFGFQDIPIR
jgi:hypothetical protein